MRSKSSKRIMDLTGSLAILILIAPVYLLCVLAVWFVFRRPVHFRQQRLGFQGRPFKMYKFRTMSDGQDAMGRFLPDEQRINLLGRFMRHTSLDELPQLFNILKGEMSLVGPRPQLACFTADCTEQELRRFDVLPGLTGMAQVSGRNAITWRQKFRLDAWYVEHQSLGLDLLIILKTVSAVLKRRGVKKTLPDRIALEPSGHAEIIEIARARSAARSARDLVPLKVKAAKGSAEQ